MTLGQRSETSRGLSASVVMWMAVNRTVLWGAVLLLLVAVFGTVLGIIGWFNWLLVLVLSLPAVVLVGRRLDPTLKLGIERIPSAAPVLMSIAVVVGVTAISVAHPGEHLLTGRDPATYLATAGWLADSGEFLVDARVGPFSEEQNLEFAVPGFYDRRSDGRLAPEFFHAFPVLMAVPGQLGGVGAMLVVNPLIGALGLLAVMLLAERLAGPWAGLIAVSLLGFNEVFVYFTRAPFSEPLALFFFAAGFWWLAVSDTAVMFTRLAAGVILGGAFLARVDSLLLVPVLMAVLAVSDRRIRSSLVPVLRGVLWLAAFGIVEVLLVDPWYLGKFDSEFALIGFATLMALGLILIPSRLRARLGSWLADRREAWRVPLLGRWLEVRCLLSSYARFWGRPPGPPMTWSRWARRKGSG